jgi:hypothetical protein
MPRALAFEATLIKTPDRISERPPRGGLSFCADHVAVHESAIDAVDGSSTGT